MSHQYSVVIPTWNEAPWLRRVLASFSQWSALAEIVVADNSSIDGTAALAAAQECLVCTGGLPAAARNIGASHATGDIIIFCDADVIVPRATLASLAAAFTSSRAVAYHCRLVPLGGTRFVRFCYGIMDGYIWALARLGASQGVASFVAVRRDVFHAVGGFRADIQVGEDADLLRRLAHSGKVCYDRKAIVYCSARRFRVENAYAIAAKTALWALLRLTGSSRSVFSYRWRRYPAGLAASEVHCVGPQLTSSDNGVI